MNGKKFCPKCNSEDIELVAGGVTGNYMCRNCGFSGTLFPEKEIIGGELTDMGEEDDTS
jgi:transposase-like protein